MSNLLQDKVALITGGGSGIGRAAALAFAREGSKVVIADFDADGGQETVRLIADAGGDAICVATDVTQASQVKASVEEAIRTYGRLDCAFNNASIARRTPIPDLTEELWDRIIEVNLKSVWLCMKYEIPAMRLRGQGAIVNTASIYGLVGYHDSSSAYVASKHGVVGLTKAAALECAKEGIRVNAVCPGWIRTPLIARALDDPLQAAEIAAGHPLGRVGTAEEVAEAVLWLCSDAASFVTGHALAVDGGYVAR